MDQEEIKIELAFAAEEEKWRTRKEKHSVEALDRLLRTRLRDLQTLPDLGLSHLSQEVDAFCERACRKCGVDYIRTRREFEASVQVIPKRVRGTLTTALARKGVIPANETDGAFLAWVTGAINAEDRRRVEAYQQVRQAHAVKLESALRQVQR